MTPSDRAQTPLDFAIAMGIFLLAVTFVFTFIPSLTTPFVAGNQDASIAADRVASTLSEGALGDPADPYVLDLDCTRGFFNGTNPVPDGCGYSGSSFRERVGLADRLGVQVELLQVDPDATGSGRFRVVCMDGSGNVVHEPGCAAGTEFRIGETPTADESLVVARRIVTLPGCDWSASACDATLRVKVW